MKLVIVAPSRYLFSRKVKSGDYSLCLYPWYTRVRFAYQRVKNVSSTETFGYVLNEWSPAQKRKSFVKDFSGGFNPIFEQNLCRKIWIFNQWTASSAIGRFFLLTNSVVWFSLRHHFQMYLFGYFLVVSEGFTFAFLQLILCIQQLVMKAE